MGDSDSKKSVRDCIIMELTLSYGIHATIKKSVQNGIFQ